MILIFLLLFCISIRTNGEITLTSAVGDDNDCALYISGDDTTIAYDYNINLLKGNFHQNGRPACITYEAINQAYLDARNRINVAQPKGDWKTEDIASVGELLLDISVNLARTYGLSYEEIEKGLPLIDTSKTLISDVCPPIFSNVECRPGKYRRFDGLCNNIKHPLWGAAMAPFQRLLGPLFSDGINAPRISKTGQDLPLARVVSRTMHPDDGYHEHAGTVMIIAWGQFMDHDYTLTGTPLDPNHRNDPEECCKRPPHLKNPYCNEIRIPEDDYFYKLFGMKCMDFVRAFPSPRAGCRLGSRNPFNTLTGVIDGNTVYGVSEKFARKLRTGYGGLLRMNPVFEEYGLKDMLPLKLDIPDEGCIRPNKNMYCFEAGEIRVNEQLVLACMHTLMAREHNRVAKGFAQVNPHWDDEVLYQEARRVVIAEIQHITYAEFLPILLGKDVMEKFDLLPVKEGYWDGYDQNVNPDVIDAFASAAFRFGHSLLPTAVERWSKAHKFIASKRLSDLIRRPYDLYRAGVFDEYIMGLMNQVAQAMDDSITQEVTNHLFKKVGARFGMDLVSFNMQRGREFGIPGYMEFRKFCGLPQANTFQELYGSMPNETIIKYESIFEHPDDIDLWSGGVSERPLPGSMLGPTFACIIATQFAYSRKGDRFWFELPNQPSSFTPEQLAEVRKSRLARVICDNTDIIDTVQVYPMVLPDHELNPRVPCRSGILPSMDFSKWAEPVPIQKPHLRNFFTEAILNNSSVGDFCSCSDEEATVNVCNVPTTEKTKPSIENHAFDVNIAETKQNNTEPSKVKTNLQFKFEFNANKGYEQNKPKRNDSNKLKRNKRQTKLQQIILDHLDYYNSKNFYDKIKQKTFEHPLPFHPVPQFNYVPKHKKKNYSNKAKSPKLFSLISSVESETTPLADEEGENEHHISEPITYENEDQSSYSKETKSLYVDILGSGSDNQKQLKRVRRQTELQTIILNHLKGQARKPRIIVHHETGKDRDVNNIVTTAKPVIDERKVFDLSPQGFKPLYDGPDLVDVELVPKPERQNKHPNTKNRYDDDFNKNSERHPETDDSNESKFINKKGTEESLDSDNDNENPPLKKHYNSDNEEESDSESTEQIDEDDSSSEQVKHQPDPERPTKKIDSDHEEDPNKSEEQINEHEQIINDEVKAIDDISIEETTPNGGKQQSESGEGYGNVSHSEDEIESQKHRHEENSNKHEESDDKNEFSPSVTPVSVDYENIHYYPGGTKPSDILNDSNEDTKQPFIINVEDYGPAPIAKPINVEYENFFYPLQQGDQSHQLNNEPVNPSNYHKDDGKSQTIHAKKPDALRYNSNESGEVSEEIRRLKNKTIYSEIGKENIKMTPVKKKNLNGKHEQYYFYGINHPDVSEKHKRLEEKPVLHSSYENNKQYHSEEKYSDEEDYAAPKTPNKQSSEEIKSTTLGRPSKYYILKKIKKRPLHYISKESNSDENFKEEKSKDDVNKEDLKEDRSKEADDVLSVESDDDESEDSKEEDLEIKYGKHTIELPEIKLPENITNQFEYFKENTSPEIVNDDDVESEKYFDSKYKKDGHGVEDDDYFSRKYKYDEESPRKKDKFFFKKYRENPYKYVTPFRGDEEEPAKAIEQDSKNPKKSSKYRKKDDETEIEEDLSKETDDDNDEKQSERVQASGDGDEEHEEGYGDGDFEDFYDRGVDLYEKFVQDNFKKVGTFYDRAQKLFEDSDILPSKKKEKILAPKKNKKFKKFIHV